MQKMFVKNEKQTLTYILQFLHSEPHRRIKLTFAIYSLNITGRLDRIRKFPSDTTERTPRNIGFLPAAHVETSIVAHLENASSQTEESKIAANFQTVYAKQFLPHKLHPNLNEQSRAVRTKMNVWSGRVRNS